MIKAQKLKTLSLASSGDHIIYNGNNILSNIEYELKKVAKTGKFYLQYQTDTIPIVLAHYVCSRLKENGYEADFFFNADNRKCEFNIYWL